MLPFYRKYQITECCHTVFVWSDKTFH